MLRKKAKGLSIALVTIMALTSVNFGSLNEFSLFTENTAMAQEETRVLTEFEDSVFREALVSEHLGGTERTTLPENAAQLIADSSLGEDYEYPIFSTDIEELEKIEKFYYDGASEENKIKSVKGIERLKNLKKLKLYKNSLSAVDLSKNELLEELNLEYNKLNEIDIRKNKSLKKLDISNNNLSKIDVSQNEKLELLILTDNNLSKIDVSQNKLLGGLNLSNNNLSKIDVSQNVLLVGLILPNNKLNKLNVSNNIILIYLDLSNNGLSKIDLNNNNRLEELNLYNNNLKEIDLNNKKDLKELNLSDNDINYLNLFKNEKLSNLKALIIDQSRKEKVKNPRTFDLKEYLQKAAKEYHGDDISEEDLNKILSRVESVEGEGVESYDMDTGTVTLKEGFDTFTYNLEVPVGNNGYTVTMDVTVKLIKKKPSGGSSSKPVEEPEKDKEETEEKTPETEVQDKAFVEGYEDGTFKPDASITRAEAAAMFARLLEGGDDNVKAIMPAEGFSDLSEGWYKKYMDYMAEKGIMKGYGDGTIKPESPITRAEFSQMISSQLDNEGLETDLTDIENHWAKKAVEKAFEKNIVNGYPDRTFRPDNEITRAEAAKMLNRFAGRIVDAESIKSVENPEDLVKFTDVNEDHWGYYEVMEVANSHTCERDEKTGKEKWIKIIK